ncbi:hypothetical protein PVT67_02520 [Gallaecimonas kandeliae]|uniref:hypothetical protein n=1 Tax=Gallaecimonas kandeliae TaxID=3029055 RepID=UPI0026498AAC|nr:hypothetical protein [Gallaecimonas kandeliae]WKE66146.1 hypothetical protein PVT67_02520 [Gallaecimonas kandeliae]
MKLALAALLLASQAGTPAEPAGGRTQDAPAGIPAGAPAPNYQPAGGATAQLLLVGSLHPALGKALSELGLGVESRPELPQDGTAGKVLVSNDGRLFEPCQQGAFEACIFINADFKPETLGKPTLDLVNAPRLPLSDDLRLRRQRIAGQPQSRFQALALRGDTKGEEQEQAELIQGWLKSLKAPLAP